MKYLEGDVNSALSCDPADIVTEVCFGRVLCAQMFAVFVYFFPGIMHQYGYLYINKWLRCVQA